MSLVAGICLVVGIFACGAIGYSAYLGRRGHVAAVEIPEAVRNARLDNVPMAILAPFEPRDLTEDWIFNGRDLSIGEFLEAKVAKEKEALARAQGEAIGEDAVRTASKINHEAQIVAVRLAQEAEDRRRRDIGFELQASQMMTEEQRMMSKVREEALNPPRVYHGSEYPAQLVAGVIGQHTYYQNGYFVP